MKRIIALSLLTAAMLGGGILAPAHAQTPGNDLKPTFISPTPGLYVNGWPAFTAPYPKDWVEVPLPGPGFVFSAGTPRPDLPPSSYLPSLSIYVIPNPLPLEDWAKLWMPIWVEYFTDIKVLSDKPSQLKDAIPAREVEYEAVPKNGPPKRNFLFLATKKDATWVAIILADDREKIGEDLRGIAYSLTFQPGRETPVNLPSDVRAFLDMYCVDVMSHDVKAVMAHFSDRFRHSGASKAFVEQWIRNDPGFQRGFTLCEETVTVFEPRGDKAYIDGFSMMKAKGDADAAKIPMSFQQIINEHGQWKWFGNQK